MATHKSAEKRARQNTVRNLRNSVRKTRVKKSVKNLLETVKSNDKVAAEDALKKTTSVVYKAVTRGVLHKKTAARKISRLSKKVSALAS